MKVGAMHEATMTTKAKAKRPGGDVRAQALSIVKIQKVGPNRNAISGRAGAGPEYRDRHAIRGDDVRAVLYVSRNVFAYARLTRDARWHIARIAPLQSW
jgi:hypothetical protein